MLRTATFVPEDWDAIRPRAYERRFDREIGDHKGHAEALDHFGLAWVLVGERGKALACGGILKLKPGVGELWGRFSTALPVGAPSRLWAEAFHLIDLELARQLAGTFHRVQIAVPLDFEPGLRFARRLKFHQEGILRQYGADRSDYAAFARVRV